MRRSRQFAVLEPRPAIGSCQLASGPAGEKRIAGNRLDARPRNRRGKLVLKFRVNAGPAIDCQPQNILEGRAGIIWIHPGEEQFGGMEAEGGEACRQRNDQQRISFQVITPLHPAVR
jgi:hypothetical protein